MIARVIVQPGRYHDSVRLMQASRTVQGVAGVGDALIAMGTELNLSLLDDMGFDATDYEGAGPNDLLIGVRAESEESIAAAQVALDDALAAKAAPSGGLDAPEPRTIGAAAGDANIALVSVPGEHAFVEAMDALRRGLHVMIFSDNVSFEHELALKEYGAAILAAMHDSGENDGI